MHDLDQRNQLALRVGPVRQVGNGPLLDDCRDVGEARPYVDQRGAVVDHVVQRRDVDAGNARERTQRRVSAPTPGAFPYRDRVGELADDLLTVTEHKRVDEIGHRFGVVRAVSAGDDERISVGSIFAAHGHACEVDEVEDVRVDELG